MGRADRAITEVADVRSTRIAIRSALRWRGRDVGACGRRDHADETWRCCAETGGQVDGSVASIAGAELLRELLEVNVVDREESWLVHDHRGIEAVEVRRAVVADDLAATASRDQLAQLSPSDKGHHSPTTVMLAIEEGELALTSTALGGRVVRLPLCSRLGPTRPSPSMRDLRGLVCRYAELWRLGKLRSEIGIRRSRRGHIESLSLRKVVVGAMAH